MTTAAQESIEVAGLRVVGTSLALGRRRVAVAGASSSVALITGGSHRHCWR